MNNSVTLNASLFFQVEESEGDLVYFLVAFRNQSSNCDKLRDNNGVVLKYLQTHSVCLKWNYHVDDVNDTEAAAISLADILDARGLSQQLSRTVGGRGQTKMKPKGTVTKFYKLKLSLSRRVNFGWIIPRVRILKLEKRVFRKLFT